MKVFPLLIAAVAAIALLAAPASARKPQGHDIDLGILRFAQEPPGPPGPAPAPSPRSKSKGVRVLAHADPGGGFNGDVVAHRGFAYLASWGVFDDPGIGDFCPSRGVRVYDLHNPRNPRQVATFADGASEPELDGSWTEKIIVRHVHTRWFTGQLAAVSIQVCGPGGFAGFGLWDVSNPRHPRRLALYETPGTQGSHEIWLQPRGDRAHVYTAIPFSEEFTSPDIDPETGMGTIPGEPDFRIIDVSNPRNPQKVGAWGAWAELGLRPFSDEGDRFTHSVIGDGKLAYLSYWDLGTVILDVTDPATPRFVGRTRYTSHESGNAHSAWLAKGGNVLIQTDEDFSAVPGEEIGQPGLEGAWGYARIFDISRPARPVQLSTFKMPTTTQWPHPLGVFSVHDPKVRGSTAYLSWYSEGVVVVDISRPAHPRFIAQFVPPPTPDPMHFWDSIWGLDLPEGASFPLVWGVFVDRDYVLASDINSGLWVFQVR